MKLYEFKAAPNPRRVRIFLAEKGIDVPTVQIDLQNREQHTPEFLARNPMGGVPCLELDDGGHISESVAICRYFEGLQPEPCLMGAMPEEAARIEMWNRRMELDGMAAAGETVGFSPSFKAPPVVVCQGGLQAKPADVTTDAVRFSGQGTGVYEVIGE